LTLAVMSPFSIAWERIPTLRHLLSFSYDSEHFSLCCMSHLGLKFDCADLQDEALGSPAISFGFRSSAFDLTFVWALGAYIDDSFTIITNDESTVYTENMIETENLKELRNQARPMPPVAPLSDQWMAVTLEFLVANYSRSFVADPDIRLELLFDNDDPEVNTTAIVIGVVVAVVVVGAVVASLAIPSLRSRIYPFLSRSKEAHLGDALDSDPNASLVSPASGAPNWQAADRHHVDMRNTK
jgi:hypothetical protein